MSTKRVRGFVTVSARVTFMVTCKNGQRNRIFIRNITIIRHTAEEALTEINQRIKIICKAEQAIELSRHVNY